MSTEEPPLELKATHENAASNGKGSAFWLSFCAIIVSIFLSALDLTGVATALPTITDDLHGADNFVWVGSAYALSSTAILPLSGSLADIFGRKPIMLLAIVFCLGSALAGAAQNMNMLIAARTVQGIGGGGIINLTEILTSDLVPLAERGVYQGILGLTWSFASGIGPPLGGIFAQKASWRWLFYLNLPLSGIAFALVVGFLRVQTPEGSMRAKLERVDWLGNFIVISGITLAVIGLTWGGIHYPWDSAHVLAPLIIGLALTCLFFLYERNIPREPTIPWQVVSNRTSFSGYIATTIHGITSISIIYYLPVYFQASLGASPIRSGVDLLATALVIAFFALIAGVAVQVMNKYRPANAVGWAITIVGFGLLTLLRANAPVGHWVGYQIVASAGTGAIFAATIFPVLAPLPVSRTAAALAFFAFVRAFAQTWGITISSTILQNELKRNLPPDFVAQFPKGLEIAYAAIPQIPSLQEPLRSEVQAAFATSMAVVWKTMIGISGLGFLTVFLLKEVPMKKETDSKYGLDETGQRAVDEERTRVEELDKLESVVEETSPKEGQS
ncbi:putative transporter C3H1.06c [Grifola frondosa]|uniref:Putative transporter C3H1.06c n=1 Tax=Grifola frondosa TaxID=5627 RepID=A0A1C7LLK0_GRIFR|nr:putative transporter C3H1.06c [Grifola frondosa]